MLSGRHGRAHQNPPCVDVHNRAIHDRTEVATAWRRCKPPRRCRTFTLSSGRNHQVSVRLHSFTIGWSIRIASARSRRICRISAAMLMIAAPAISRDLLRHYGCCVFRGVGWPLRHGAHHYQDGRTSAFALNGARSCLPSCCLQIWACNRKVGEWRCILARQELGRNLLSWSRMPSTLAGMAVRRRSLRLRQSAMGVGLGKSLEAGPRRRISRSASCRHAIF